MQEFRNLVLIFYDLYYNFKLSHVSDIMNARDKIKGMISDLSEHISTEEMHFINYMKPLNQLVL